MSAQLFSGAGGYESAGKAGFKAGFTQAYTDSQTAEELLITVIEFSSPAEASSYYHSASSRLLGAARPTYTVMAAVPATTEVFGSEKYNGYYVHAACGSTHLFYFQVVYQDALSPQVPIEFTLIAKSEWELLQPGVSLPPRYTSTITAG